MANHEIPREEWREELDRFSRRHHGWIVRVAVTEPNGQLHTEVRGLPLQGVTAEAGPIPSVAIMAGRSPDVHLTRDVQNPVGIAIERTDGGAESGLRVRERDGTVTIVEFRSPARPEEVDGM